MREESATLSREELGLLQEYCSGYLTKLALRDEEKRVRSDALHFRDHLIILTMLTTPPQRKQFFRALHMDGFLPKTKKRQHAQLFVRGQSLKTSKAALITLPGTSSYSRIMVCSDDVAHFYQVWVDSYRLLMCTEDNIYLFPGRSGVGSAADITKSTNQITKKVIGRQFGPHAFRY